jgi:biopolymer transport protein ExbD
MRVPHVHRSRQELDIAMTPMIDVVFLLLIFFICTASFQMMEYVLPANLAVASGTNTPAPVEVQPDLERVLVQATRASDQIHWVVNERPCDSLADVRRVLGAVAQIDRSLPVTLDVRAEVPLGDMIDLYDLCRQVGFERIELAASTTD